MQSVSTIQLLAREIELPYDEKDARIDPQTFL